MKLSEILKGSEYKLTQFSEAIINELESRITEKTSGAKTSYSVVCLVRNKEIKLTPEECIRQMFLMKLNKEFLYPYTRMALEYAVAFGRDKKRADIVIFDKDQVSTPYIIVELKSPKLKDGKEQLKSYCNGTGAPIGVWTNGESISYYHRKDPNFFEDIPTIPNASEKLSDILSERWTIDDLIAKDKLVNERKSLKDLILEMEDEVLANAGVDVFEEVFKLIFTKLYDEMESGRKKDRHLAFRNYGDTEIELKDKLQKLFNEAKEKWSGIFTEDAKIMLTPSHLSVCVSSLQDVKLFNSNLDVVDEAFEYLINKSSKGEKGQYFTPRYVIDMCVKMLNPSEDETMIDTAAGSCGFPVHTIFYVWQKILERKGLKKSHLFTLEQKPQECTDYVQNKVFAIDFDEKAVRVARTLNLIAGDGQTNVMHLNTLDYERWDENLKDENWQETFFNGWTKLKKLRVDRNSNRDFKFDILMANPPFAGDIKESRILAKYELSKNSAGKMATKVGRDILFIERNLDFLKPGGRMAIVLPQGRFNNSSDKYIRDYIAERCRILAVVGLHGNVFKPHTGTKTSVLFVQKWDDELCPRKDDYPIFFATMQEPSKDNSGEKIFVKKGDYPCTKEDGEDRDNVACEPATFFETTPKENNEYLLDSHRHLIVKHDLFNHDGLTRDGIAEAFAEFAKKEGLSFFLGSPFDKEKYESLLKGLEISKVRSSQLNGDTRIDAEYFSKSNVCLHTILLRYGVLSIGDIAFVTDGIHTSIDYDQNGYINLISATSPRENVFDLSRNVFISEKAHSNNPRTALRKNDVIISTVGTIGNCAVVDNTILPANSDRHVGIIRLQKDYSPYVLSTFMLSKYGRMQTLRESTGNVQLNLFIYKLKELLVPNFPKNFQLQIEQMVKSAHAKLEESKQLYTAAENQLLEELCLKNWQPKNENINVKTLSESFLSSGRLDAEYYQSKYDELFTKLSKYQCDRIANIVKIKKSIEPGSDAYRECGVPFVRVSDVTKFGISEPSIFLDDSDVLKSLKLKKDTILLSKDGSIGIAYKVDENMDCVTSGALLHLSICNKDYNPDYLTLVLNSNIVKLQAERDSNGAIIQHWKPSEIEQVLIPKLSIEIQNEISAKIQRSFALKKESKSLLEQAKTMVENEIEKGV